MLVLAMMVRQSGCGHDDSGWQATWRMPDDRLVIEPISRPAANGDLMKKAVAVTISCPVCRSSWEVEELGPGMILASITVGDTVSPGGI